MSRRPALGPGRHLALGILLLALGVPVASAGELSKEEGKWADACLRHLPADDDAVRRGARLALAALGTDAVPRLAEAWHGADDARRIESVLLLIGREPVLRRLRAMQADARAAEARRLEALMAALAGGGPEAEPPVASGEGDARSRRQFLAEGLARLGANSPRVRAGAERALVVLGVEAVPGLVDVWTKAPGRTEEAAVPRLLLAIGRDAVVPRLQELRADARGVAARRLDELLETIGGARTPGGTSSHSLSPSRTLDWSRVPCGAEHTVGGHMPAALGLGHYPARLDDRALVVDVDGDGTPETRLQPGDARTLVFRARGAEHPVLVYEKLGRWYACSASLLVGDDGQGADPVPIVLLDGDLDGSFGGERDHLRIGDGAFQRFRAGGTVLWGEDRARYALVAEEGRFALQVEILERPAGIDRAAWDGLVTLNRFRHRHGLPPLGHDPARSAACRKHAEYLATNIQRRGRQDLGGTTHDEDPSLPGYTAEGAQAGASSNISGGGDLARAVERIGLTMLHRAAWLCDAAVDVGLGATQRAGGWSVVWTGAGVADGPAPVLVPAPGARDVPRRGSPEWPPPERAPAAYDGRIGYPVSVTWSPLAWTGVNLELYLEDEETPVPGHVFTPSQPISSAFPHNGGSAFFLPSAQLTRGARYWAVFTASASGRPVRFAWTFFVD